MQKNKVMWKDNLKFGGKLWCMNFIEGTGGDTKRFGNSLYIRREKMAAQSIATRVQ